MDSGPSAASSVLPDVSQIHLSTRRTATSSSVAITAGGRPVSAHQPYGPRAVSSSPVDTVLRNFRVVRQREQELQQQRQAALQRFSVCSTTFRAQHVQQQNQHNLIEALQRQRPGSARLARHPRSMCASDSVQQGQDAVIKLQHWEPPASSTACNSFRHSLPPHSQRPAMSQSPGQRPGTACLSVSAAQRCSQAAQGRQSSFSKRAAYGDVLRRICTPQTSSLM